MVSTRSSNRSSQLSGPVAASEPDPLPAARSRRRQSQPMRGTRSSIGPGFEIIDEEGPEYEPRASMSSPGALALAHRYGTPARRAAPMPFEAVSLSQLTAHSSVQDNSYQDNPFQGDVETISSDDESSVITATPEPRSAQAPSSMTRTPVAEAAAASQADIEDEREEASRSPSPNESQADSQAGSLPDADTIELRRTCIEDLAQATKKLVETLYSETVSPNVRNSRLIKIRRPAFDGLREVYDSDEQFIDVPAIFDSLGPNPPQGALSIICQANLAKIIDILVETHVPSELGRLAKLLDVAHFPEPYTPSDQNDVDLEAVDYAMDIRIQSFLATLATNPHKDRRLKKKTWLEWVIEAFCTRDSDFDDEEFVEGDMADICGIPHPLPEPIAQHCLAKLNAMLEIAESDGSTVASVIETLSTAYPVSEWRASLLNYAFEEFFGMDEEEEGEESQHGSEEPDARPEDQLEGRAWVQPVDSEEPVPDQDDELVPDQDEEPILGQDEEPDVQEEDQPEEEPQEDPHDDPQDEPEEELENPEDQASTNPQNKHQPVEIQDSDEESPAPSDAPAQRIIRRPESTAALPFNREMVSFLHDDSPAPPPLRAPENRQGFLSRLASRGEARIEASQSLAEAGTPASSAVSNNGRKRRREDNDEDGPLQGPGDDEQGQDEEEEDEFEIDARQPDERRRQNMPPPPKRPRTAQNPPPASAPPARPQPRSAIAAAEEEDPFASPPARSVRPPSASQPPAGDGHPDFVAIHQANRLRAAEARPQHRVPWSNEDTLKLIDFIAEHNCAWVAIYEAANPVPKRKSRDQRAPPFDPAVHFSSLRNQQAIRDKARNLKVDFLKADLVLPVGFDNIVLGKKEIDILTSRNKNPDRLEADIDARGVPTNTYWESW